jgi:hypothetical protein
MNKDLISLQSSLIRLNSIYKKLKSVDQWQKLRQDELARQPLGSIKFSNNTPQELSSLYSDFLFEAQHTFDLLNSIKKPSDKINQLKKQINTICCQIYYFGSGINFY